MSEQNRATETPIKPQLLAPAGDLEKLIYAIEYGADAVYFGGKVGSLRAGAGNFSVDEIAQGTEYCHERGKKAYLTLNFYPHEEDGEALSAFLESVKHIELDGIIVADPGVLSAVKRIIPGAGKPEGPEFHLSTQANVTSADTARFWYEQGVRRIILARELSLVEIRKIRDAVPNDMALEAFVHGAMCMSYSGRCLLSNFLTGRDANRGDCSHTCRWKYALVEEKRPGEYIPVEEDARGTYFLNSRDLCMLEHISDLRDAGISSLKIEGRMKSIYYIATVIRAYRHMIDEEGCADYWKSELRKASHRKFTTGFYYGNPGPDMQDTESSGYERSYTFIGVVTSCDEATGIAEIEQRNKFSIGDKIEIFGSNAEHQTMIIEEMYDENQTPINSAPHAQMKVLLKLPKPAEPFHILRRAIL
jgi:putative protease